MQYAQSMHNLLIKVAAQAVTDGEAEAAIGVAAASAILAEEMKEGETGVAALLGSGVIAAEAVAAIDGVDLTEAVVAVTGGEAAAAVAVIPAVHDACQEGKGRRS